MCAFWNTQYCGYSDVGLPTRDVLKQVRPTLRPGRISDDEVERLAYELAAQKTKMVKQRKLEKVKDLLRRKEGTVR